MDGNSTVDVETWIINTVFYAIGGSLALVTNLVVFVVILGDKDLRKSSFFVEMAIVSVNRFSVSLQLVVITVYRFMRLLDLVPDILDRGTCYGIFFMIFHFAVTDMAFLCMMAVDRFIAIARPFSYKALTANLAAIIMGCIFVVGLLGTHLPAFFDGMPVRVDCLNMLSPLDPLVFYGLTLIMLLLSFAIVILYGALILYVLLNDTHRFRLTHQSLMDKMTKKQMDLLSPLMVLVVSATICVIIPKTLFFFASLDHITSATSARLIAYGGVLSNIDFNVTCWALLARSSDFRAAFRKRFL